MLSQRARDSEAFVGKDEDGVEVERRRNVVGARGAVRK